MALQVHSFVMHLMAKVNVYQLATLGLILGLLIAGIPGGGGSGA